MPRASPRVYVWMGAREKAVSPSSSQGQNHHSLTNAYVGKALASSPFAALFFFFSEKYLYLYVHMCACVDVCVYAGAFALAALAVLISTLFISTTPTSGARCFLLLHCRPSLSEGRR